MTWLIIMMVEAFVKISCSNIMTTSLVLAKAKHYSIRYFIANKNVPSFGLQHLKLGRSQSSKNPDFTLSAWEKNHSESSGLCEPVLYHSWKRSRTIYSLHVHKWQQDVCLFRDRDALRQDSIEILLKSAENLIVCQRMQNYSYSGSDAITFKHICL